MIFIVGMSGNNYFHKEKIGFFFFIYMITIYLFFLKPKNDIFSIIFPNLTIFQIKNILWKNFIIMEKVFELLLDHYIYK